MVYSPTIRSKGKRNATRSTQVAKVPAPINGIDARNLLGGGSPQHCIYAYNLVPDETGVKVRKGYREWVIGLGSPVRTIIPFKAANPIDNRLFVATSTGIYDVTEYASTPVLMTDPVDWQLTGDDAGWGVFINYVSLNGDSYCFYADQINGLFRYTGTGGLTGDWVRPTDITGVSVENINFVAMHKIRIWFGVENDATAYYLPIDAIAGLAESFEFGGKFKHGGALKGLYNWTVDGGIGVDDYLVAVSTSGDVIPYTGSDPSQSDWGMRGSYYIGKTAKGARCASTQGGNLHLLSAYGLISMSDLLRGVDPRLPDAQSISAKIAPFLREETDSLESNGWSVVNLPNAGVTAIVTPTRPNGQDIEYIYNLAVDGWGLWRDVPINCIDSYGQYPYVGTADGRVLVMDVVKDNVLLNPVIGTENGVNIQFSLMFSYSDLGAGGLFKRGMMARPDFISKGGVAVEAKFFYDYDTGEILTTAGDAKTVGYQWDVSNWDDSFWNSSILSSTYTTQGASGMGRSLSLALKGNCLGDTIFASVDVFYNIGGGL
ncbi:MAG: hypothetical protein IZT57_01200 [Chloroflexi bacterium]|nr:hypothetical protein [Chloroflexota bacterium]